MEAHNHGVAAAIIQVSSIDDAGNDSALLSSNVEVIRAGGLFNSLRKRTSMTAAEKRGRWRSCGLRRRAPQAVFNDAVQLDGQEETILALQGQRDAAAEQRDSAARQRDTAIKQRDDALRELERKKGSQQNMKL